MYTYATFDIDMSKALPLRNVLEEDVADRIEFHLRKDTPLTSEGIGTRKIQIRMSELLEMVY